MPPWVFMPGLATTPQRLLRATLGAPGAVPANGEALLRSGEIVRNVR